MIEAPRAPSVGSPKATTNFQAQKIPIIDDLENKESFVIARIRQLDDLSYSLKNLEETTTNLLSEGALNPKSASSSRFREVLPQLGKMHLWTALRCEPFNWQGGLNWPQMFLTLQHNLI